MAAETIVETGCRRAASTSVISCTCPDDVQGIKDILDDDITEPLVVEDRDRPCPGLAYEGAGGVLQIIERLADILLSASFWVSRP